MILSRRDARRLGMQRYFTGQPCARGHLSERYTITGNCIACLQLVQTRKLINGGDFDDNVRMAEAQMAAEIAAVGAKWVPIIKTLKALNLSTIKARIKSSPERIAARQLARRERVRFISVVVPVLRHKHAIALASVALRFAHEVSPAYKLNEVFKRLRGSTPDWICARYKIRPERYFDFCKIIVDTIPQSDRVSNATAYWPRKGRKRP